MSSKKTKPRFWALSLAGLTASLVSVPGAHATTLSSSFVLEGRLYNSDRTDTVSSSVDFLIGVYSPDGTCLLYEESASNIDLSQSDGLYRLMVGANTKSAQDPGLSFSRIFSNSSSPIRSPSANCPAGYTPAAGDLRNVRLQVTRHDTGATETLSPDLAISPIPQATVAETVQGLTPLDLLQISGNSTPYTLTKSALDVLLGPGGPAATAAADASSLHHHDSLYAKLSGSTSMTLSSGSLLGLGPRTSDPTGLSGSDAGKTWYDSTSNQIKYWNGSSVQTVGTGSSGVSSVASAGSPISIGGTASAPTVGITQATSVADGYLSSADWLSFNNKVSSQWSNGASSSINYTAGNVGIGTTSPGSKLDVVGNALIGTGTGTSLVTVNASGADSARGKFKILGGGFGNPSWDMGTDSANDVFEIGYIYSGSRTSRFAITQAGNVGIGTTSPTGILDVAGGTATATGSASGINLIAQNGLQSGVSINGGGNITISAGKSWNTSGGNVVISGGKSASSGGNNTTGMSSLTLNGDSSSGGTGGLTLSGGVGSNGVGAGASLVMVSNGGAGAQGIIQFLGSSGYNGAKVNIVGGAAWSCCSTPVANGGDVQIDGGAPLSTGSAGNIILGGTRGNVGIGTTSPNATLQVNGTLTGKPAVNNATSTVNFSNGNLQYTTNDCGAFQFNNLKDGGNYTFIVQGTNAATCSFSAYSDAGTTALTVHMPPDIAATTAGKHTIFNIIVAGTHVYIGWTPGY